MPFLTKAPLVLVKVPGVGDDYRVDYHYAGSVIPKLTDDQAKRLLDLDMVEKVGGGSESEDSADGKPVKLAPKADWVAYAVSQGVDPDEAEGMTKAELTERFS